MCFHLTPVNAVTRSHWSKRYETVLPVGTDASKKEVERDQAEEGLHSKHNITFQGSILEVQRFANDDGLSVIFFADKHSWQL